MSIVVSLGPPPLASCASIAHMPGHDDDALCFSEHEKRASGQIDKSLPKASCPAGLTLYKQGFPPSV